RSAASTGVRRSERSTAVTVCCSMPSARRPTKAATSVSSAPAVNHRRSRIFIDASKMWLGRLARVTFFQERARARRPSQGETMITSLTPDRLASSVLAVPPLCRNADFTLNETENSKLIRHMEAGGIRTLLYGGNANFYHVALSEYDQV